MNTSSKLSLLCVNTLLLTACQSPELPSVAKPIAQLTDEDREVMKAVLEQTLRPVRDRGLNNRAGSASSTRLFLVFDSTIEVCPFDPVVYGRRIPGCMGREMVKYLNVLPFGSVRRTENLFTDRNSRPLSIGGILAEDVVYVPSATVETPPSLDDFVRQYPLGSAVVVFSAPVYPIERAAVIFYRYFWNGGGFVHLERVGMTWSPVKTSGWIE